MAEPLRSDAPRRRGLRIPLLARILAWFFLNLLMVAALVYAFLSLEFRLGLDSILLGHTNEQLLAVRQLLAATLAEAPRTQWEEVLERFSKAYGVKFYLFRLDGTQAAGEPVVLPEQVRRRLRVLARPERRRVRGQGPPWRERAASEPGLAAPPPGPPPRIWEEPPRMAPFLVRTEDPPGYWVGVRLRRRPPQAGAGGLVLLAMASSWGGMFFADPAPWLLLGGVIVVLSVLFWLPMVRGLTGSIRELTRAAERIAEGRFDVEIDLRRRDELGRLAVAINRMTARLREYIAGQQRFLGDIAHELFSPLARMQMALGVLEKKVDASKLSYVEDVKEEIEAMSALAQEILTFARAWLAKESLRMEPINLKEVVEEAARREGKQGVSIQVSMPEDAWVLANRELTARSVANLIRNAVRYAGDAGPITVSADRREGGVLLVVGDQGPGIPEKDLERVFDPFYRVEPSRDRGAGGVGLGLAIVKQCVEACGGRVRCRNRRPRGLEAAVWLPAAPSRPKAGGAAAEESGKSGEAKPEETQG